MSGRQISDSAEDAVGLATSERFRLDIRQYTREMGCLQSGVNMVQTAERALGTQQDNVARLRKLAVQAANETLSVGQRVVLNQEAAPIIKQIDQAAGHTQFNGQPLLDGSVRTVKLGVAGGMDLTLIESTVHSLQLGRVDLTTREGAAAAVETLDKAATRIVQNRASLSAQQNEFTNAIERYEKTRFNMDEPETAIRDSDMARGVMDETRNAILAQQGLSALVQANVVPHAAARLLTGE